MIDDPENTIAHAYIYTWQGMSIGAIHYYAELRCGDAIVKATAKLTERHAAYLNEENRRRGYKTRFYYPGKEYGGFLERQEAVDAAIATYKAHFPQARCLLLGQPSYIEPFPVLALDGPAEAMARLNEIAERAAPLPCEAQGPFTEEWEKLLAETLGLEWVPWM